jgi:hypothetical protein
MGSGEGSEVSGYTNVTLITSVRSLGTWCPVGTIWETVHASQMPVCGNGEGGRIRFESIV